MLDRILLALGFIRTNKINTLIQAHLNNCDFYQACKEKNWAEAERIVRRIDETCNMIISMERCLFFGTHTMGARKNDR